MTDPVVLLPLIDTPVAMPNDSITLSQRMSGRRLRTFAQLVSCERAENGFFLRTKEGRIIELALRPTYGEAIAVLADHIEFTHLPLCVPFSPFSAKRITTIAEMSNHSSNPSLVSSLQDLSNEINMDVEEACAGLDNPTCWFPGVDEGIDPVTDDHVRLVIAGIQRELNRELRIPLNKPNGAVLPAVPLATLPFRIQRALAERRRLRYLQWGIGKEEWELGEWNLWNVHDDPDWVPRWTGNVSVSTYRNNDIPEEAYYGYFGA